MQYADCNCNYVCIHPVALAKRQLRDDYGFRMMLARAHLSTIHDDGFIMYLFIAEGQAVKLRIEVFRASTKQVKKMKGDAMCDSSI